MGDNQALRRHALTLLDDQFLCLEQHVRLVTQHAVELVCEYSLKVLFPAGRARRVDTLFEVVGAESVFGPKRVTDDDESGVVGTVDE